MQFFFFFKYQERKFPGSEGRLNFGPFVLTTWTKLGLSGVSDVCLLSGLPVQPTAQEGALLLTYVGIFQNSCYC